MSSEKLKEALGSVSIDRFDSIVPDRRSKIEPAEAKIPSDDYNTNRVARSLHPARQIMTISEIEDLPSAKRFRLTSSKPALFAAGQYISVFVTVSGTATVTNGTAKTVAFTNTRNGIIPTGIILTIAPFAIGLLVFGAVVVFLVAKKRRKYEEE